MENVTSVHGLPFSMHCVSIGEPTPVMSWLRDGSLLKPDVDVKIGGGHGETLHFRHSYDHHSGNYTCTAKNNAGTVSKTFLLDVLGKQHLILALTCNLYFHFISFQFTFWLYSSSIPP